MSKADKMFDGITQVRDDLLEQAELHVFKTGRRRYRFTVVAVACLLVVAILTATLPGQPGSIIAPAVHAIAEPRYPQMTQYPKDPNSPKYDRWRKDVQAQRRDNDFSGELEGYLRSSIPQFLSGREGENALCSPINVYMALAMLAETAGGQSRQQILDLLGSDSIESLRQQAGDLWNANYRDDGIVKRLLGSSIWLSENLDYNQTTLDTLAGSYYAAAYSGEMGSEDMNEALRDWIDTHTGGLLQQQTGSMTLPEDGVMALATTVWFKASWDGKFGAESGIFHTPQGEVEQEMLKRTYNGAYYWGDRFAAAGRSFETGSMYFLLPDEGVTPEELLQDEQALSFVLDRDSLGDNRRSLKIHMTVPAFDIEDQMELSDDLQALGVTDVFDSYAADFSPLTEASAVVSDVTHGARLMIDKEGCEAVAYTMVAAPGAAPPGAEIEEIDFTVDRPFLFVLTGANDLPLFVGIVNQP